MFFGDNPDHLLKAYVDSEEGLDRAGGFAVQVGLLNLCITRYSRRRQGRGNLLIRKIDGDFYNVMGFPGASFFKLLDILVEDEEDFLAI